MRKSVFLAFSVFLTHQLASAKDVVTISCPDVFPNKTENNKSQPLAGMDVWDGASLQEPDIEGGATNSISGDGIWEIHCHYGKGSKDHYQVTIEIPKGSRYCTGTGLTHGKHKEFCMGPKEAVPTTPPPMFIAQLVDYTATLQGFGLRQTAEQIIAEAQRQGLRTASRIEAISGGGQRTRIDVAAPNALTILLSPQTKLSVEVRQDFPSHKEPRTGTDVIGPHLFGDFSDLLPNDGLVWDQKTGVIVISQNWRTFSPDNYIRLIDDAEISKETGQPLGHKKYMP